MEKFISRYVNIIVMQRYTNVGLSHLCANDANWYTQATDLYNWLNKCVSSFLFLLTQSSERYNKRRKRIQYNN